LYSKQDKDGKSTCICGVSIPGRINTFLNKKTFSFVALHENVFKRNDKQIVSYMLVVDNFTSLDTVETTSGQNELVSFQDEYGYSQGPMDSEALDLYLGIKTNPLQKQEKQDKQDKQENTSNTNPTVYEYIPNGTAYSEEDLNSLLGLA